MWICMCNILGATRPSHFPCKDAQIPAVILSSAAILSGTAAAADSQPWLAMPAKRTMARPRMMTVDFILR